MGSNDGHLVGLSDDQWTRLKWELLLPLVVLAPAYALVPDWPEVSLIYIGIVLLPIGIAGGILGEDRRAENAAARGVIGEADATHGDTDAKIGPGNRWTDFASSVGLLGLGSFVLIAVLFV
ncbi:hypothetical protein BRD00_04375 [Halobacteriales archaeon QS_8_69_26]|nr:MAG: hypothetical protein BRD00_04375 [Halobacteriales archaeon QS_8_69_26]